MQVREVPDGEVGVAEVGVAGTMARGGAGAPSILPPPLKAQNKGVPGAKSKPARVTTVPPLTGPCVGEMEVMVGARR